ncbi:hypothetical protein OKA05_20315 [Luteolibacter arcticus]|uniref:Uncharacterized protein n=1 Tax=Luteolibacter arcticus TaxID=1581411 RepID=A0ABT3GN37_9BACT|nr:hypothetical protein [Luteolibacter arcticus]MCW1924918.1 hypothetical protein [Luteolibacter arcticus]
MTSDLDFQAAIQAQLESCDAINTIAIDRTTNAPFMLEKQHKGQPNASQMLFCQHFVDCFDEG